MDSIFNNEGTQKERHIFDTYVILLLMFIFYCPIDTYNQSKGSFHILIIVLAKLPIYLFGQIAIYWLIYCSGAWLLSLDTGLGSCRPYSNYRKERWHTPSRFGPVNNFTYTYDTYLHTYVRTFFIIAPNAGCTRMYSLFTWGILSSIWKSWICNLDPKPHWVKYLNAGSA